MKATDAIETLNAKIKRAILTKEEGYLTVLIEVEHYHGNQIFGNFNLHKPRKNYLTDEKKSVAGEFIARVMEIADVNRWDDLRGKIIRIKYNRHEIHEIGHPINEDWLNPKELIL